MTSKSDAIIWAGRGGRDQPCLTPQRFSDDSVNRFVVPTVVATAADAAATVPTAVAAATVAADVWITVAGPPPRPSTAGAQTCRDGEACSEGRPNFGKGIRQRTDLVKA